MAQPSFRRLNAKDGGVTYLEAQINGRSTYCLLDSGCQFSTLLARFVAHAELELAEIELFAANGSKLPVLGRTNVTLEIQGLKLPTTFLVSQDVDEILLGINFLVANDVDWQFANRQVKAGGVMVPLLQRPVPGRIRRVYAAESVIVSPSSEIILPVSLAQVS